MERQDVLPTEGRLEPSQADSMGQGNYQEQRLGGLGTLQSGRNRHQMRHSVRRFDRRDGISQNEAALSNDKYNNNQRKLLAIKMYLSTGINKQD